MNRHEKLTLGTGKTRTVVTCLQMNEHRASGQLYKLVGSDRSRHQIGFLVPIPDCWEQVLSGLVWLWELPAMFRNLPCGEQCLRKYSRWWLFFHKAGT